MKKLYYRILLISVMAGLVSACSVKPVQEQKEVTVEYYDKTGALVKKKKFVSEHPEVSGNFEFINKGDGNYLNVKKFRRRVEADSKGEGITLNFENAEISEVVSIIIGKILKDNYLIDPAVKGMVNLRTVKNVNKNAAFYILENILDVHGARIVRHDGHYRILPKNKPVSGMVGLADDESRNQMGYGFRVVELDYIAASEMVKILESVTNKNTIIRLDEKRNILIVGGTGSEVNNILDTIALFDTDWMKGTSVGLVRIRYSKVKDIVDDLHKMFKTDSAAAKMQGVVSFESIDRLNSIMIIGKNTEYVAKVKEWINKLDIPEVGEGNRLYVYQVRHSNAEALAATLMELFSGKTGGPATDKVETLAPGAQPVTLNLVQNTATAQQNPPTAVQQAEPQKTAVSNVRIIPAGDSNSLLIMSTPGEFARIEEALELLDIPPLQVLIEVSIMDIRLSDDLSYGMQWFFNDSGKFNTQTTVGDNLNFPQTFSYSAVKQTGNVSGLIGMLASEGKVNVLSSPSILVKNNEKASIRVGDQQPINTAIVGTDGKFIATSVQFKDTGVILEIKPTVNTSGTVNVDISQEVTDIGDIDDATGQRAFLRRSLKSAVSVADGETIVLGGLIRSNKAETNSGVPGFKDIPLFGSLFGKTITTEQRTELIIVLTPKVIRNSEENNRVLKEYKEKFQNLFNGK
ncbi:MAG: type II secretion system secretin GspD [Gammaproteobacteria bacterium]|nr:type II secretion system secretin GspD [Gammaproteobacteria bacterium]MDH5652910.1 type II secretion system secretin GspD [Gammaproteobacteria bacterium]